MQVRCSAQRPRQLESEAGLPRELHCDCGYPQKLNVYVEYVVFGVHHSDRNCGPFMGPQGPSARPAARYVWLKAGNLD